MSNPELAGDLFEGTQFASKKNKNEPKERSPYHRRAEKGFGALAKIAKLGNENRERREKEESTTRGA